MKVRRGPWSWCSEEAHGLSSGAQDTGPEEVREKHEKPGFRASWCRLCLGQDPGCAWEVRGRGERREDPREDHRSAESLLWVLSPEPGLGWRRLGSQQQRMRGSDQDSTDDSFSGEHGRWQCRPRARSSLRSRVSVQTGNMEEDREVTSKDC